MTAPLLPSPVPGPAPLALPTSPIPILLTSAALFIPYSLLSLAIGFDPRALPAPIPTLLLILTNMATVHLLIPFIVALYAPSTPKGRYSAVWSVSNLNLLASSVLWIFVFASSPEVDPVGWIIISVGAWIIALLVLNIIFYDSSDSPWNDQANRVASLVEQLRLEKLRSSIEAAKAELLEKEKEYKEKEVVEAGTKKVD